MKLVQVFIAFLVAILVSAEEERQPSHPLQAIKNLKNTLSTKSEAVGRLFKLLSVGSLRYTTERPPKDESLLRFPHTQRNLRRLNIFGLQVPPNDPLRNADGTPCSCETGDSNPEILHIPKAERLTAVPSFTVVHPHAAEGAFRRSEDISVPHYYPKLNLDELLQPQSSHPSYHQGYHQYVHQN